MMSHITTMPSRKELKEMEEMLTMLEDEDNNMMEQLGQMEETFAVENKVTLAGFNELYLGAGENYNLNFGVICEKGRDEVIEKWPKAKDFEEKQKIVDEYTSCVELTRQKAALRSRSEEQPAERPRSVEQPAERPRSKEQLAFADLVD